MSLVVTKRDGSLEPVDVEKFNRVAEWACEGLFGTSASELAIKTQVQFYDKIKTIDLMNATIKSAADLISDEATNYQYVAGRLINYNLRKEVYNNPKPSKIYDHIKKVVNLGFYTPELLELFTEDEWNTINVYINHDRDFDMTYAAMEQWRSKYLVKNRVTGQIYETPQMAYMLIAATLFASYPKQTRLKWIKEYYDAISTHYISLPTPVMAGVRTPQKQFSSCVLVDVGDSIDSINEASTEVVKYIANKAGIGINVGRIRAVGSKIRSGDAYHTGLIPFIKLFQASVKSVNQGGVRSAAGTVHFQWWHYEIEDLLVLKNSKGIEDNRARHLDYSVQFNKLAYDRLINNQNVSLFSPKDVPGLYEAFVSSDHEKFKKLYEAAEKNTKIKKKTMKAIDLFTMFMNERKNTGRIYLMNIDHANSHSSFDEKVAPITMSNLCQEIALPTTPAADIEIKKVKVENDLTEKFLLKCLTDNIKIINQSKFDTYSVFEISEPTSLTALCTLSAINWGKIKETKDFEKICNLAVRALDSLLDYQTYVTDAAKRHTSKYRPIGVGIIGFAHFLAKNNLRYSDGSALELVNEYAEAWSYYLLKASNELAKEKGACPGNKDTKYSQGILPIDTYKKDVDTLVKQTENFPWQDLREDMKQYGIRNATVMALMPSESSSLISNETNGVEPVRDLISIKQNKDFVIKQVVPEFRRLKNKYEFLWDQKSPEGYLHLMAVLQKYIDQSISVNQSYNPEFYEKKQLLMSDLIKHILCAYKFGLKNLYYLNTNDSQKEVDSDKILDDKVQENEEDCDSCKI